MEHEPKHQGIGPLLIGLVFVGVITGAIMMTLQKGIPGAILTTRTSTAEVSQAPTLDISGTQTVEAILTVKSNIEATEAVRTRVPRTPIFRPTGIYEDERVFASANKLGLNALNGWSGLVGGYHFFIYAGALQTDPSQGAVYLVVTMPQQTAFEQYLTSEKHGSLRVLSEQNDRLNLVTTDGTSIYFDIPTRQFILSSTAVAPSVTPSPTQTTVPLPTTPSPTYNPYPLPTAPSTDTP
jgi:hypothetical protein